MTRGESVSESGCPSDDALAAFVEGTSAPALRGAIEAHLAGCSRCAATLAAFARDFAGDTLARDSEGDARPGINDPTLSAEDRGRAPARERPAEERYVFGEPFGAGGLGVVRRAEDRRLHRPVAVKELLLPSPATERRFLHEAAITARLQHPSIVPIYDIGRHPTGEPYYCMKLIEGRTLEAAIGACDGLLARLGLLEHVIAAADAVAYAHRRHVIHRDLKPANILIGEVGETVVIDWGLAKDLTGELVDVLEPGDDTSPDLAPALTQAGAVMGTLRYMPPEQATGREVDARSDVFALGAVLFHVLAGEAPYAGVRGPALVLRVTAGAVGELRALVPEIPAELAAIAHKAMAPAPEDRYASASDFAEDLRRFRTGRLVGAHHYSPGDVLRRWLRRHRALVLVSAGALAVLAVFGALAVQNIRRERDLAEDASTRADSEKVRALAAEAVAEDARAEAERQQLAAREHLVTSQTARATDAVQLGASNEALIAAGEALVIREDATARGALVAGASGLVEPLLWSAPLAGRATELRWHPVAGLLALESDRVERWTAAGEALPPLTGGGFAFAIEPSPDGTKIALDSAGVLAIYEPAVRTDAPTRRIGAGVWSGAYGFVWRDDDHLAAPNLGLWRLSTGARLDAWQVPQGAIRAVAGSADGKLTITGSHSHRVCAWDTWTMKEIGPLEDAGVGAFSVALSPDQRWVAAGGEVRGGDGKVRIWDMRTHRLADVFRAHRGEVHFVGFSPDGRWLATSGSDEVLRLWHVPSFTEVASLSSPGGRSPRFAFAPDGSAIAVAFGEDPRLRVYSLGGSPGGIEPKYFPRPIERVAWSPDGRRLAAAREDGVVHVFDTQARTATVLGEHDRGAATRFLAGQVLAWAADDRLLLARGDALALVDPTSGAVVQRLAAAAKPYQLAPPAQGRALLADLVEGLRFVHLDGRPAPRVDCPLADEKGLVESAGAWTPDGAAALVLLNDGRILRVPADGSACAPVGPADLALEGLALDATGTLAAATTGEELLLLDVPALTIRARLERRRATLSSMRFTADGRRLLTADWSGRISVWRLADGALVARWRGHQNRIWAMELAPDQRTLATGSADRTLRTWELAALDVPRDAVAGFVAARTGAAIGR